MFTNSDGITSNGICIFHGLATYTFHSSMRPISSILHGSDFHFFSFCLVRFSCLCAKSSIDLVDHGTISFNSFIGTYIICAALCTRIFCLNIAYAF